MAEAAGAARALIAAASVRTRAGRVMWRVIVLLLPLAGPRRDPFARPSDCAANARQQAVAIGQKRAVGGSVAQERTTMIDFRILGPLEVQDNGRLAPLGGTRQRAVLAILLLHRGEVVSTDRLVDELWGERPPDTATKTVQVYVSRLRKELGQGVVLTRGGGYVLDAEAGGLDAERFERLTAEGRDALNRGESQHAGDLLREALGLWRGPPLGDLAYEPFAQGEVARLEELRMVALEHRIEAD